MRSSFRAIRRRARRIEGNVARRRREGTCSLSANQLGTRRHAQFQSRSAIPVDHRASNSFSHLYSRADIEACLGCVRRHLAPSGRFVIQVFNPALSLFVRPSDHRIAVATYVNSNTGTEVKVSKCVRYDSAAQISHETWYFRDEVTGQEDESPLNLRMFFPQEIDAVLHYNGFSIEHKYGDQQVSLVCELSAAIHT